MMKPSATHGPCPMMDEPGLQRCMERLQAGTHRLGSDTIPSLSQETLRCYDQRARELRSELWVSLGGRLGGRLRRLITRTRKADRGRRTGVYRTRPV